MSPRDPRAYLWDIAQAAEHIARFTQGKTATAYASDLLLRSAVERQFEIVGEALNQRTRLSPDMAGRITNVGRIIAFRNRLAHGYASIADGVVWGIIEADLPTFRREIGLLLAE